MQKYVSFSDMPKQKGNAACTYQLSKVKFENVIKLKLFFHWQQMQDCFKSQMSVFVCMIHAQLFKGNVILYRYD